LFGSDNEKGGSAERNKREKGEKAKAGPADASDQTGMFSNKAFVLVSVEECLNKREKGEKTKAEPADASDQTGMFSNKAFVLVSVEECLTSLQKTDRWSKQTNSFIGESDDYLDSLKFLQTLFSLAHTMDISSLLRSDSFNSHIRNNQKLRTLLFSTFVSQEETINMEVSKDQQRLDRIKEKMNKNAPNVRKPLTNPGVVNKHHNLMSVPASSTSVSKNKGFMTISQTGHSNSPVSPLSFDVSLMTPLPHEFCILELSSDLFTTQEINSLGEIPLLPNTKKKKIIIENYSILNQSIPYLRALVEKTGWCGIGHVQFDSEPVRCRKLHHANSLVYDLNKSFDVLKNSTAKDLECIELPSGSSSEDKTRTIEKEKKDSSLEGTERKPLPTKKNLVEEGPSKESSLTKVLNELLSSVSSSTPQQKELFYNRISLITDESSITRPSLFTAAYAFSHCLHRNQASLYTTQLPYLFFSSTDLIPFVSFPYSHLLSQSKHKYINFETPSKKHRSFSSKSRSQDMLSNSLLLAFLGQHTETMVDFLGCPTCHRSLVRSYLSSMLRMVYHYLFVIGQLRRHMFYLVHVRKMEKKKNVVEKNNIDRKKKNLGLDIFIPPEDSVDDKAKTAGELMIDEKDEDVYVFHVCFNCKDKAPLASGSISVNVNAGNDSRSLFQHQGDRNTSSPQPVCVALHLLSFFPNMNNISDVYNDKNDTAKTKGFFFIC
jgi:hypothetical protein